MHDITTDDTVIHGYWDHFEDVDLQCSVCGTDAPIHYSGIQWKSKYCPNCGAKMDGKEGYDGLSERDKGI